MIKRNILIAEDALSSQLLVGEVIKLLGHCYQFVSNGKEAIEKHLEQHFDIILMDIEMPIMNGKEAAKHIRTNISDNKKKNVPIIALTFHNNKEYLEEIRNVYGFNDYISKPYTIDEIEIKINKHTKLL